MSLSVKIDQRGDVIKSHSLLPMIKNLMLKFVKTKLFFSGNKQYDETWILNDGSSIRINANLYGLEPIYGIEVSSPLSKGLAVKKVADTYLLFLITFGTEELASTTDDVTSYWSDVMVGAGQAGYANVTINTDNGVPISGDFTLEEGDSYEVFYTKLETAINSHSANYKANYTSHYFTVTAPVGSGATPNGNNIRFNWYKDGGESHWNMDSPLSGGVDGTSHSFSVWKIGDNKVLTPYYKLNMDDVVTGVNNKLYRYNHFLTSTVQSNEDLTNHYALFAIRDYPSIIMNPFMQWGARYMNGDTSYGMGFKNDWRISDWNIQGKRNTYDESYAYQENVGDSYDPLYLCSSRHPSIVWDETPGEYKVIKNMEIWRPDAPTIDIMYDDINGHHTNNIAMDDTAKMFAIITPTKYIYCNPAVVIPTGYLDDTSFPEWTIGQTGPLTMYEFFIGSHLIETFTSGHTLILKYNYGHVCGAGYGWRHEIYSFGDDINLIHYDNYDEDNEFIAFYEKRTECWGENFYNIPPASGPCTSVLYSSIDRKELMLVYKIADNNDIQKISLNVIRDGLKKVTPPGGWISDIWGYNFLEVSCVRTSKYFIYTYVVFTDNGATDVYDMDMTHWTFVRRVIGIIDIENYIDDENSRVEHIITDELMGNYLVGFYLGNRYISPFERNMPAAIGVHKIKGK